MIDIQAVPILQNNYVWVLIHSARRECVVFDPGHAAPIIDFIEHQGLTLKSVVITHSHHDHVGGIDTLIQHSPAPVIGPHCPNINQISQPIADGEHITLWPDLTLRAQHTPGHLPEHLIYHITGLAKPSVICGDIIFSSGCGRNFIGTFEEFYYSLDSIAQLPPQTDIFASHEYTLQNIDFALTIEPKNSDLILKKRDIEEKLALGGTSYPTTVEIECKTNPFLRCHLPHVHEKLYVHFGKSITNAVDAFGMLRQWKDNF